MNSTASSHRSSNPSGKPASQAGANRKAAWLWGSLIVGLLSLQVAVGVVAIVLATGDPSVAIVPDYYEKALNWDDEKAMLSASDKLGWNFELSVSSGADLQGQRTIVVTLRDQAGVGIENAAVKLSIYHHARAADLRQIPLRAHGGGHYSGLAAIQRGGNWEVELTAIRPAQGELPFARFIAHRTVSWSAPITAMHSPGKPARPIELPEASS